MKAERAGERGDDEAERLLCETEDTDSAVDGTLDDLSIDTYAVGPRVDEQREHALRALGAWELQRQRRWRSVRLCVHASVHRRTTAAGRSGVGSDRLARIRCEHAMLIQREQLRI